MAPPETQEYKKNGKKAKKGKKKAKATGLSGFVEVPPPAPDEEPVPSSPDLAKTSTRDETQTSASSYSLLEGTTGERVDDRSATFLSSDDAHDPEIQCARRPEHLTPNGGWKTCLDCRKLVQKSAGNLWKLKIKTREDS